MGGYPNTYLFLTNLCNSKNFYKCFDFSGGYPNTYLLLTKLCNTKNFYKCLTFLGGKKFFFLQKCPKSGLVSLKKIHCIFDVIEQKNEFLLIILTKMHCAVSLYRA